MVPVPEETINSTLEVGKTVVDLLNWDVFL